MLVTKKKKRKGRVISKTKEYKKNEKNGSKGKEDGRVGHKMAIRKRQRLWSG